MTVCVITVVCFCILRGLFFLTGRYVRVLGAFYLRLVGTPADIYQYLEPLYNDYRKIKMRLTQGTLTK